MEPAPEKPLCLAILPEDIDQVAQMEWLKWLNASEIGAPPETSKLISLQVGN